MAKLREAPRELANPINGRESSKSESIDHPAPVLVDSKKAAAAGSMSVSWWEARVAEGVAPAPAFRGHRCTRWRWSDVVAFWERLADLGSDPLVQAATMAKARNASRVAHPKKDR